MHITLTVTNTKTKTKTKTKTNTKTKTTAKAIMYEDDACLSVAGRRVVTDSPHGIWRAH